MSARAILAVVIVAVGVGAFLLLTGDRGRPGGEDTSDTAAPAPQQVEEESSSDIAAAADAPASKGATTAGASSDAEPNALTADEGELLTMYDEISSAFEQNWRSCNDVAASVEAAVEAHSDALERIQKKRMEMSPAEAAEAKQRLEAAQGERIETLRGDFEQMMAQCKSNQRLRRALRDMATVGQR